MVIKFNRLVFLFKKQLSDFAKETNILFSEGETLMPIKDSVLNNANHFIEKMSEIIKDYDFPDLETFYPDTDKESELSSVTFLWELSITQPSIFLSLSFSEDDVYVMFEDDDKNIRGTECFDFSAQTKSIPEGLKKHLLHFISKDGPVYKRNKD